MNQLKCFTSLSGQSEVYASCCKYKQFTIHNSQYPYCLPTYKLYDTQRKYTNNILTTYSYILQWLAYIKVSAKVSTKSYTFIEQMVALISTGISINETTGVLLGERIRVQ